MYSEFDEEDPGSGGEEQELSGRQKLDQLGFYVGIVKDRGKSWDERFDNAMIEVSVRAGNAASAAKAVARPVLRPVGLILAPVLFVPRWLGGALGEVMSGDAFSVRIILGVGLMCIVFGFLVAVTPCRLGRSFVPWSVPCPLPPARPGLNCAPNCSAAKAYCRCPNLFNPSATAGAGAWRTDVSFNATACSASVAAWNCSVDSACECTATNRSKG